MHLRDPSAEGVMRGLSGLQSMVYDPSWAPSAAFDVRECEHGERVRTHRSEGAE